MYMANNYLGNPGTVTVPLSVTKFNDATLPASLAGGLSAKVLIDMSNTALGRTNPGLRAILTLDLDVAAGGASLSADATGHTSFLTLSAQAGSGDFINRLGGGIVYPVNIQSSTYSTATNDATVYITLMGLGVTGLWANTVLQLSATITGGFNIAAVGASKLDNLWYLTQGVGIVNARNSIRSVGSHARRTQYLG